MADSPVQVWVDRATGPARVGTLFVHSGRRSESSTFEYAASWLSAPEAFALDPTYLPLGAGPFRTPVGSPLFAALTDSAPDRWGRTLMQRASRRRDARTSLREIDYLLGVDDFARQGALRFRFEDDGPFLAHDASPIPPLVRLGELLSASDAVQRDELDEAGLRLLLVPGSSLGGARPKASIVDAHGELSVAKFPALTDEWSVIPPAIPQPLPGRRDGRSVAADGPRRGRLLWPRRDRRETSSCRSGISRGEVARSCRPKRNLARGAAAHGERVRARGPRNRPRAGLSCAAARS